jgi:hypothetical protein
MRLTPARRCEAGANSPAPRTAIRFRGVAIVCLASLGGLSCHDNSAKGACLAGDAAGPALVTAADQLGGLACATDATPDATIPSSDIPFAIDTGGNFVGQAAAYFVGANYGQPSCPDQFLMEMDLTASNAAGKDVFFSGRWSTLTAATPCGYGMTLTIWGYSGSTWTRFDQLVMKGQSEPLSDGGTLCHEVVITRQIQTPLGGTWIPAGTFTTARVAGVASDCGQKLAVNFTAEE